MNFKASMDWLCTAITTGTSLLFAFTFVKGIVPVYEGDPIDALIWRFFFSAFMAIAFFSGQLGIRFQTAG